MYNKHNDFFIDDFIKLSGICGLIDLKEARSKKSWIKDIRISDGFLITVICPYVSMELIIDIDKKKLLIVSFFSRRAQENIFLRMLFAMQYFAVTQYNFKQIKILAEGNHEKLMLEGTKGYFVAGKYGLLMANENGRRSPSLKFKEFIKNHGIQSSSTIYEIMSNADTAKLWIEEGDQWTGVFFIGEEMSELRLKGAIQKKGLNNEAYRLV